MAATRRLATALLACGLFLFPALSQELDDAITRLGQRFGRRPISLSWQNLSSMPQEEADRARQRVEAAFEISPTGIETKATLSENQRGYLLVLQTPDGKAFVESWSRPPALPTKPPFRLKQSRLGESPRPLLDAAVSPDGQRIVLLEPFRVSGSDKSTGLPVPRPMPRDPRGRVQVSDAGDIRVQLPGVRCTGTVVRMQCTGVDDSWIVPGRNYFKGPRGPYYSTAEIDGATFESSVDGLTRVYPPQASGQSDVSRVIDGWSSELAPVESQCGAKIQIIASLETEQVQAFEYSGGRLRPATPPLPTDGPIVALWNAVDRRDQVTLVVRNRTKGIYEASRLAIACSAE